MTPAVTPVKKTILNGVNIHFNMQCICHNESDCKLLPHLYFINSINIQLNIAFQMGNAMEQLSIDSVQAAERVNTNTRLGKGNDNKINLQSAK